MISDLIPDPKFHKPIHLYRKSQAVKLWKHFRQYLKSSLKHWDITISTATTAATTIKKTI